MRYALTTALKAARHDQVDKALVAIARRYAAQLDDADDAGTFARLAPGLVTVLDHLGMTPKARSLRRPIRDYEPQTDGADAADDAPPAEPEDDDTVAGGDPGVTAARAKLIQLQQRRGRPGSD